MYLDKIVLVNSIEKPDFKSISRRDSTNQAGQIYPAFRTNFRKVSTLCFGTRLALMDLQVEHSMGEDSTASSTRSPIFYEILAYLFEHPDAQDTVEGIVEWWLLTQRIKQQTARVKAALRELVALGVVKEVTGRDGCIHYRVDRRKARKIRKLLAEHNQ